MLIPALACAVAACTSDGANPRAPADAAAPEPGADAASCTIEEDPSGDPVSFARDLMPLFAASCAFGGCHDSISRINGLYLGPNLTEGEADAETRAEVRASLLSAAKIAEDLPRVTPFEPSRSFVMFKVQGCQNTAGLRCNGAVAGQPCGQRMPALSERLPQASRHMLARWIAEGAADD